MRQRDGVNVPAGVFYVGVLYVSYRLGSLALDFASVNDGQASFVVQGCAAKAGRVEGCLVGMFYDCVGAVIWRPRVRSCVPLNYDLPFWVQVASLASVSSYVFFVARGFVVSYAVVDS